ncbi:hypothetical protein [Halobacillus karajensis]|uniref:hypothetical protein n=1 Tax=Halobacillus karajensis TaxID=195088 RepID=UPI00045C3E6E|nr:hypothetical protein [Halobacillus karajensis]CDQ21743.1 hypothetical protein BN982_04152 [Halobacillus karajensis]
MSKKPELPNDFDDVAGNGKKEEEKTESNSIDSIIAGVTEEPKAPEKKQVSVYLEKDVAREFEKFGKREGKGKRSKLVNDFLKQVFRDKL